MQNFPEVQLAVTALKARFDAESGFASGDEPIGLILGTGLSGLGASLEDAVLVPWEELPGFRASTVQSHSGCFALGRLGPGRRLVLAQEGRRHLYEGASPAEVCMGVRVMAGLGVRRLIITNASGAINPQFDAGGLLCMTDQINATGRSPLVGPNDDAAGPRFPDMSAPFDAELRALALECARREGIRLERGVYIGVLGPQLETPAETRMYRQWGADAVGMSTVLEVIAARHLGMRVLGLSCMTNKNLPDCMAPATIEEIVATAEKSGVALARLLTAVVTSM